MPSAGSRERQWEKQSCQFQRPRTGPGSRKRKSGKNAVSWNCPRGKMAETKACVLPRRGSLCLPIMRHGLSVWHVTCTAPVAHPALTSPAGSPQWPGSLQAMSLSLQAGPPGFVQAALVAQHGRMARGLILPAPGHQASP